MASELVRECVQRAAGNPLFLEQLLLNAEEAGLENLPGTIQSLVHARLDRLDAADKQAVQAAAVLGQRFSLEALRHLVEDPAYDGTSLVAHFLVRREGSGFLFCHALIRNGVYESALRTRRRQLHARAAGWYEKDDPVLAAEHFERAEDKRAPAAYLTATALRGATVPLHARARARRTRAGSRLQTATRAARCYQHAPRCCSSWAVCPRASTPTGSDRRGRHAGRPVACADWHGFGHARQ